MSCLMCYNFAGLGCEYCRDQISNQNVVGGWHIGCADETLRLLEKDSIQYYQQEDRARQERMGEKINRRERCAICLQIGSIVETDKISLNVCSKCYNKKSLLDRIKCFLSR